MADTDDLVDEMESGADWQVDTLSSGDGTVEKARFIQVPGNPSRVIFAIGGGISWSTIGGETYMGEITDIEEGVATVRCTDGQIRAVEID